MCSRSEAMSSPTAAPGSGTTPPGGTGRPLLALSEASAGESCLALISLLTMASCVGLGGGVEEVGYISSGGAPSLSLSLSLSFSSFLLFLSLSLSLFSLLLLTESEARTSDQWGAVGTREGTWPSAAWAWALAILSGSLSET